MKKMMFIKKNENINIKQNKFNKNSLLFVLFVFLVALFISCATINVESPELLDVQTVKIDEHDKVFAVYKNELNDDEISFSDRYIFFRLYNPVYDNPFCVESILANCIKTIDVYSEKATHSAIGFNLEDCFYGLTTAGKVDFKIESCTDVMSNPYMKKCNIYKSVQTTYAIKVTKEEFEKAKKLVEDYYTSEQVKYDVFQNFCIGGYGIKRSLFYKDEEKHFAVYPHKNPENTFAKDKTEFVCSTFVAYVLANSVESIRQFFVENKIDSDYVLPSDLMFLPGAIKLFTSTWVDYNVAAKTYASCYLTFAPFYVEHLVTDKN